VVGYLEFGGWGFWIAFFCFFFWCLGQIFFFFFFIFCRISSYLFRYLDDMSMHSDPWRKKFWRVPQKKKKTLSHALNNWTEKGNSVHQPLYKTVAKIVSTDRHFETSLPPSTLGHNSKTKKVMKYEIKFWLPRV
jgi:hypothetical protein